MQGVVKSYDPKTGRGLVVCDKDRSQYSLAADALEGSILRMLRQGQRVIWDINSDGLASKIRLGSEVDMASPSSAPPTA